jgi:phosphatidate cytidylyltransferase
LDRTAGELTSRLVVAAVGIPLAVFIIYWGVWPLGILMAVAGALGAREYYSLTPDETVAFGWLGATLAAALPLIAAFHLDYRSFASWAFTLVVGATLLALALSVWFRWPDGNPLDAASRTIMGALYTGGALSFWVLLRALPEQVSNGATASHGAALLIFPLWVTWLGDTFAYGCGSRWGRAKLIEGVSPNKTLVGAIGGLAGSVLAGGIFARLWLSDVPEFALSWPVGAALSFPIAVVGQVGDLAESVMKRDAGVKDSGHLLPGHGGILDRLDALFFTVPLTYALLLLIRPWL